MLEIYVSDEIQQAGSKLVGRIKPVDNICDDCWINM